MGTVTVYLNDENESMVLQAAQAWAYKKGLKDKPSLREISRICVIVGAKYLIEKAKQGEEKKE